MTVRATDHEVALTAPQAVAAAPVRIVAPVDGPPPGAATVVLAHGAGSGPDSDVLVRTAAAVAEAGATVVTFAFGYRAAGRRAPDPAGRLLAAWRDVAAWVRDEVAGEGPLVLGGRSMGGRYASLAVAGATDRVGATGDGPAIGCDGLLLLAYPLRAAGRADTPPRTAHWPRLRVPVLFVSGDRDALCDLGELDAARRAHLTAAPSSVHVVRGADHGLRARGGAGARPDRPPSEVLADVAGAAAAWATARQRAVTRPDRHPWPPVVGP